MIRYIFSEYLTPGGQLSTYINSFNTNKVKIDYLVYPEDESLYLDNQIVIQYTLDTLSDVIIPPENEFFNVLKTNLRGSFYIDTENCNFLTLQVLNSSGQNIDVTLYSNYKRDILW